MITQSKTAERAEQLPCPVPGQVVTIPLELLPIYFAANRLEAMDLGEVRDCEQANQSHKADGVVWVKRTDITGDISQESEQA